MNLDAMLDEIAELEERFLKAGEKTDELPPQEAPDSTPHSEQEAMMLKVLYNSVENSHALVNLIRTGANKDLLKNVLSGEVLEKLKGYEDSLNEMSDYLADCLQKLDDSEVEEEPEEDDQIGDDEEEEEDKGPNPEENEVKEPGLADDGTNDTADKPDEA